MALCLASLLTLSFLASCKDTGEGEETEATYCTVKFLEYENGAVLSERLVKSGNMVTDPAAPEREGFIFDGWYNDFYRWDFSAPITKDITLIAKWLTPDVVFEHTPTGDGKTTVITKLKQTRSFIRLPDTIGGYTVTGVADGVFSKCTNEDIAEITLPEGITSVGNEAFMNCAGITIVVEGALTDVGEKAFLGCDGLREIRFGEGIADIAFEAFKGTGISEISIPKSVTLIDDNAFENCASLQTVTMHCSVADVNNSAFNNAGVKILYLYGTEAEADEMFDVSVHSKNDALGKSKVFLYSETKPTGHTAYEGFWYLDENNKTRIWK